MPPRFLWSLELEIAVPRSQMPRLETPRQHRVLTVQGTYQTAFAQVPIASLAGFSSHIPVEVHLALFLPALNFFYRCLFFNLFHQFL